MGLFSWGKKDAKKEDKTVPSAGEISATKEAKPEPEEAKPEELKSEEA